MDTRKRALSAVASTGIAFAFGASMAVAASGVFTIPDPVLVAPSWDAAHGPAAEGDTGFADATAPNVPSPPTAPELSPTSTPAPDELPRQLLPPHRVPVPDAIPVENPVATTPSVAESGHDRDCRSARNGSDARNCGCERHDGERRGFEEGPDHDDDHHRGDSRDHRHHDCR